MRTAGERIAERLVTAIALGEFVPGQRLPTERELAATLEVSRTTVREALQRLQAAGYVTTRRGRGGGTFIQTGAGPGADEMIKRTLDPAWDELIELLDYRRLVEQQIARTAAERRSDADIVAIRHAVGEYAHATDRDVSRLADHALHQAIARATHNSRLVALSARIRREVGLGFDAEPYTPEMRRRALRQHPTLAEAVIAGDPARAAKLAARHFSLTDDMLTELPTRPPGPSAPGCSRCGPTWPRYFAQLAVIQRHDTASRLGEITTPSLVLAGEQDILIPVSLSRQIHEGIPGSEWATTKGGHACVWEHPAEFNRTYLDFVRRHRKG
jgi:GntR family transcriptional repressor for pyruvate dehydrogenase complex